MHTFKHLQIDKVITQTQQFAGYLVAQIRDQEKKAAQGKPSLVANKRRGLPREGRTYRGARRNEWHAARRVCGNIRRARKEMGLSRSDFDRLRRQTAQLNVHGAPLGFVVPKAPVIRLQQPVAKQPAADLTAFDHAQLAKAEARRKARNEKRARQANTQAQRRAA